MNYKEITPHDADKVLERQKKYFDTQATKDVNFRIRQLKILKAGIKKYEDKLSEALHKDLGKHKNESYMTEIGL